MAPSYTCLQALETCFELRNGTLKAFEICWSMCYYAAGDATTSIAEGSTHAKHLQTSKCYGSADDMYCSGPEGSG